MIQLVGRLHPPISWTGDDYEVFGDPTAIVLDRFCATKRPK